MQIRNLQINHMTNPTGISPEKINVSYQIADCIDQKAFEMQVFDHQGKRVYESGLQTGASRRYRLPESLSYKKSYDIRVTAYDTDGNSATATSHITTGISRSDWQAQWIFPELETPKYPERVASYLKATVTLSAEQIALAKEQQSFLYATCHGLMTIRINGKNVTNHLLLPGTQQYNKWLMVETTEVSELLVEGENSILVALGDGWYRGAMGFHQNRNVYRKDLALLLQLEIAGTPVLITDEHWKASQNGPIGKNDFMDGECYDARKEQITGWHQVRLHDYGYDNLITVDTVPVIAHETFPAKLRTMPNNEKVFDFGQNLVGYVSFALQAREGQKLILTHGETLDAQGNFTTANFQNPNPKIPTKQRVEYICKDGLNTYHPTMTYMGFRYVKVEADFDIQAEDFTATAIYSDIPVTATFTCGNADVNQLFKNAIWSMKGNFVEVPTDCPTREKSGYSGDCQAFVHTAMYLMDCYPVYAKWIREQQAGQYADGVVPQVAPKKNPPHKKETAGGIFPLDGGIGWSDSFEIVPYRLYERYDDTELMEEVYNSLVKWTAFEMKRARKTHFANRKWIPRKLRPYIIDTGWMWGEWLEPGMDVGKAVTELVQKGDAEVGGAFYYQHLRYMSDMAERLGHVDDAKRYGHEAEKARDAYRQLFVKDGVPVEEKRQCRLVRPIAHNLLTEDEKKAAAAKLARMIRDNNNHLNTGFLSTHELSRSLTRYGQSECSYDLLLQETAPGWLYAVKKGCTTIPENWNCIDENGIPHDSFNHYSYGAIAGWMMDCAAGITVRHGKISIEPYPDPRLGFVTASYDSPVGMIVSNWTYTETEIHYHFEIPAGEKATIRIHGMDEKTVECGTYDWSVPLNRV